ncbi:M48 family metallopeptidase [Candidatus Saccharibacteria bacterium]|nr:M48 family metallopeptidase [Candidatus Saccharibacteria bacterium]
MKEIQDLTLGIIKITKRRGQKQLSLRLKSNDILISQPTWLPYKAGLAFAHQKADWILEQRSKSSSWLPESADYKRDKERARDLIDAKLDLWNAHYQFDFNQVAIRDQSSRWGSCSSLKNLNFNWKLLYLPEKLIDYVVVHELCHLKEQNHSKNFWALVAETTPDYKKLRKQLHTHSV